LGKKLVLGKNCMNKNDGQIEDKQFIHSPHTPSTVSTPADCKTDNEIEMA